MRLHEPNMLLLLQPKISIFLNAGTIGSTYFKFSHYDFNIVATHVQYILPLPSRCVRKQLHVYTKAKTYYLMQGCLSQPATVRHCCTRWHKPYFSIFVSGKSSLRIWGLFFFVSTGALQNINKQAKESWHFYLTIK